MQKMTNVILKQKLSVLLCIYHTLIKLEVIDTKIKTECYHCGEDCDGQPVWLDAKAFCCEGCKMVYEILSESNLENYYKIEKTPGVKIKSQDIPKFAYLDNEGIKLKLLDFTDGRMAKVSFTIPAIHCTSCIWLLENLHRLNPGVKHSMVNFVKRETAITFDQEVISLRQLTELLCSIGYKPDINLASSKKGKDKTDRSLYYKIGVAGFCFGNIMLLSLPEYIDSLNVDPEYKKFFSYLNLILALPVFFYASSGYFISAWKGIKHKFINIDIPIALGILTLFTRSSYEILLHTGTGYMDSLAGLVFFLLIGKWYQGKTYQALSFERDYESYFPIAVTKIKDDKEESIPIRSILKGDRVLVRNQEMVPADATLIRGLANIDYSFVTGESLPIERKSGDLLYAGGKQNGSTLEVEVVKPVDNSYLTKLWNQEAFQKRELGMSSIANKVSQYFTITIIGISLATGTYWYFTDSSIILNAITSVLIVACPCALALTIPFTFGNTMRIFGRNKLYLKNTAAIEKMAKIDDIVLDKTGTITHASNKNPDFIGEDLKEEDRVFIRSLTRNSTHPLSKSIYQSLDLNSPVKQVRHFQEKPGKGISGEINGREIRLGSEAFVKGALGNSDTSTKVYLSLGKVTKGFFRFTASYRAGLKELITRLKGKYKLHLLSGDNDKERENLIAYFKNDQCMHFNQSPEDKLKYIQKLKQAGKKVLMLGDGLNDAGALKISNVGIAVSDDVNNFTPASDAILDAESFTKLPQLLRFSRTSMKVVVTAFILSFLYNIVGLSFAVSGYLTPLIAAILMPLSSVTIVGFVILVTNILAKRRGLR